MFYSVIMSQIRRVLHTNTETPFVFYRAEYILPSCKEGDCGRDPKNCSYRVLFDDKLYCTLNRKEIPGTGRIVNFTSQTSGITIIEKKS
jgi:hypothetical protein